MSKTFYKYIITILLISISIALFLGEIITYGALNVKTFWLIMTALIVVSSVSIKNRVKKIISICVLSSIYIASIGCSFVSINMFGTEHIFAAFKGYVNVVKGDDTYYVIPFKPIRNVFRSNGDIFICKNLKSDAMLLKVLKDEYPLIEIVSIKMVRKINEQVLYEVHIEGNLSDYIYVSNKKDYSLFEFHPVLEKQ